MKTRLRRGEGKAFLISAADYNSPECLLWPGSCNSLGYGVTACFGEHLAHRAVYKYIHGEVPPLLRHTCDTPACINPAHLIIGTHADNMQDMVDRGRQCRGEGKATKLTQADVDYIRTNHVAGVNRWNLGNTTTLAEKFGICNEFLLDIVRGDKWRG